MQRTLRLIVTALLATALTGCVVSSQERTAPASPVDHLMDSLASVRSFREVAVSPDGRRVAWVEAGPGKDGEVSAHSAIFVTDIQSPGTPTRVSAGDESHAGAEHQIAWSRDSRSLAFLSDRESEGQLQLYVAPATGGAARKLTSVAGLLSSPAWSPDDKQIAVLFIENAPRPPDLFSRLPLKPV